MKRQTLIRKLRDEAHNIDLNTPEGDYDLGAANLREVLEQAARELERQICESN